MRIKPRAEPSCRARPASGGRGTPPASDAGRRPCPSVAITCRAALAAPASPIAKVATGTPGHLHDGQQRILAAQVLGRHRHAEHRHFGQGRHHARQVRGAAGAGDDAAQAARVRSGARSRRAALAAPASPIAKVATGTPWASARWTAANPRRAGTWTAPARRTPALRSGPPSCPAGAPPAPAMMCAGRARVQRRVLGHVLRHAVRGDDLRFIRHAEVFKHGDRVFHDLPIAGRTHNHAHHGVACAAAEVLAVMTDVE